MTCHHRLTASFATIYHDPRMPMSCKTSVVSTAPIYVMTVNVMSKCILSRIVAVSCHVLHHYDSSCLLPSTGLYLDCPVPGDVSRASDSGQWTLPPSPTVVSPPVIHIAHSSVPYKRLPDLWPGPQAAPLKAFPVSVWPSLQSQLESVSLYHRLIHWLISLL